MPTKWTCDVCGNEHCAPHGYEGDILCEKHATEREIIETERAIDDKRRWLESTHLQHIRDLESALKDLRTKLISMTNPVADGARSAPVKRVFGPELGAK